MAEDMKLKLLQDVDAQAKVESMALATAWGVDHEVVVGVIKSIQAMGEVIAVKQGSLATWSPSAEGQEAIELGSPEARVFAAVPAEGTITRDDLVAALGPVANVGMGKAMKSKWLKTTKGANGVELSRLAADIEDTVKTQLAQLASGEDVPAPVLKELKKRNLVDQKTQAVFTVSKGAAFTLTLEKQATELTPEMLASGAWKDTQFKPVNLDTLGAPMDVGTLHPLLKVRTEYREIFLEMGFEEMPTARYVESSFWNFDALFQPQQHPARDAHDTFFMKEPATSAPYPEDYMERVRDVHQNGGYGSQGYKYDWKVEEAQKNLLRTHTTAVSSRMLYKLAQQKPFKPVKYFSIDRVFRNETLDATHLAEFHQIEGLIAGYNLTLGDLMGTLDAFFKRLGIENLRFKPAFNPYTEPSMEVFSYHPGLDKVVEIGNSGVFRPEMLRPMGLPEDVTVIAWGLSLERPTMIKYGYSNIRDLIGPKVDLQAAKEKPLVRV
eukprot:m.85060 g.85060  ORF g.85060 m.85060 type:complete len:494 (-) comp12772_c1_seq1:233-1714(-)